MRDNNGKISKRMRKVGEKRERVLHDKVVHNKSSTASLKQLHGKLLSIVTPLLSVVGTMWVRIHPVPQTPP